MPSLRYERRIILNFLQSWTFLLKLIFKPKLIYSAVFSIVGESTAITENHPIHTSFMLKHLISRSMWTKTQNSSHTLIFCSQQNCLKKDFKRIHMLYRYYRVVDPPKLNRSNQSTGPKEHKKPTIPRNPIITVTEHTPTPSPDFMKRQVRAKWNKF